jgi:hypothetical protein
MGLRIINPLRKERIIKEISLFMGREICAAKVVELGKDIGKGGGEKLQ